MFIGHYGPAFIAKAAEPRPPLWVYFVAVQLIDILLSLFLRLGIEHMRIKPGLLGSSDLDLYYMPFTHGFFTAALWSLLAGAAYRWWRPAHGWGAPIAIAIVGFSHWIADFIAHPPDLPLWGNAYKVGLGLWGYKTAAVLIEVGLFLGGFLVYLRSTEPRGNAGIVVPWLFATLLVAAHVYGHAQSSARPASFDSVTIFGLTVFFVIALLAYLTECTRNVRTAAKGVSRAA